MWEVVSGIESEGVRGVVVVVESWISADLLVVILRETNSRNDSRCASS